MKKIHKKLAQPTLRNWNIVAARSRVAGPMKSRAEKRAGSKAEDWEVDFDDEIYGEYD